jgi:TetR/AcrR family transcriptional repressor of nem operon
MDIFWKLGFEGAHLSTLVEVTGLNRFSLYKEFGGKEGLFEEALERYLAEARDFYAKYLDHEPYGLDNIRSYFSAIHYGPNYYGCFTIHTLIEKNVVSPKAFEMVKTFSRDTEILYLKNLEAAKSQEELPKGLPMEIMAKLLLSFDQGLAIYGIVQPSDQEKDQIVDLLLNRLLATGAPKPGTDIEPRRPQIL